MTANTSIDPALFLHEQLSQASPDLMRELLGTFVNALLSAQADSVCGAEYGVRSPDRVNTRIGYRHPGKFGASNVVFADGHVEPLGGKDFPRSLGGTNPPEEVRDENGHLKPTVYADPERTLDL